MYLLLQLWWFLLLAFLLGTLLGYLLWRACGRQRIVTHYERSNKELMTRLGGIEHERSRFTGAAVDAEGDNAKLKSEIAGLQGKLAHTSSRMNAAVDAADAKLKSYVDSVRSREESMGAEIEKLKKDVLEGRKVWDAEKAAAKARDEKHANDAVLAKKSTDEAQKKHAEELKKAHESARTELAAQHTAELKKVQEQAKQHESKVLALTQAAAGTRKELDDAKARHTAELKNAREVAVADAAKKHADDVKKARDQAMAEAQAKHVDDLKKVQEQAKQHETKVLALTQADTGARKELEHAKARHAADVKKAREEAAAEAGKKHAEDIKKARDQAVAETQAEHAADLKKTREEAAAAAKRAHDEELARFKREAVAFVAAAPTPAASDAPNKAANATPVRDAPRGKAPGSIGAARGGEADDLKLIWGVGPEIEKLLNQNGIYHFDQVAAWSKADVTWFDKISKVFEGRVEREKWVEQSKKLATGWRPDREIGEKPAGLTVLKGPRDGKADDLKLIWGVGAKLEKMLNGAGFFHFDQVAKWGPADIEWVDSQLGEFAGRAVRDKWVDQCKKLATGWRPSSDAGEKPE